MRKGLAVDMEDRFRTVGEFREALRRDRKVTAQNRGKTGSSARPEPAAAGRGFADVAGMAEMRYGAGRGRDGVVLVVTLGTGIGSALFTDGHLVPNTEFGHIEIDGQAAESRAADSVRTRKDLSWKRWAERVDEYLHRLAFYLWPDLIIIGGGVSKKHDRFLPLLTVDTEIVPARLRNEAGIVGAACASATAHSPR